MKKFLILIYLIIMYSAHSIEKPILKAGYEGNTNLKIYESQNLIYPSILCDNFYLVFDEKFNKYFNLILKSDFYYKNYNKYEKNINDLKAVTLNNNIGLLFNFNEHNRLNLYISPCYLYKDSENLFKNLNAVKYSLRVKNFSFKTEYSNNYILKKGEAITHRISFYFYWNFPKAEFIKFNSNLSVFMQNGIYEKLDLSPLKSAAYKFEVALDFNNKSFEEIFENSDYQINFDENRF